MIYTNLMGNLPVGRCRYGLIYNENGFLIDDDVVARLDENSFICHTTTGGAEHIYAWMEEWFQCEWWNWQVYILDLTEQFAQIGIAGSNSRKILEKLGAANISAIEYPYMSWKSSEIAGLDCNIYQVSFTGVRPGFVGRQDCDGSSREIC